MTDSHQNDQPIIDLYQHLLDSWNRHNAQDYAALFDDNAAVVGFDGSQMNGRAAIETELSRIFTDHVTATYVSIVREVRFLSGEAAVLRAVAGMIPPGGTDIKLERNAVQTLVAVKQGDAWRIVLFQNTPARFDGRPDLAEALTKELRALV